MGRWPQPLKAMTRQSPSEAVTEKGSGVQSLQEDLTQVGAGAGWSGMAPQRKELGESQALRSECLPHQLFALAPTNSGHCMPARPTCN